MSRLAALQPRSQEEAFTRWAVGTGRDLVSARRAIDPTDDTYDEATYHAWVLYCRDYMLAMISSAGVRQVDLLLLPENTLPTGAFIRAALAERCRDICRWSAGVYLPEVAALARKYAMVVASCLNYVDGDLVVNAGILTDETGEIAGVYHKSHLPCYEDESTNASEAAALSAGSTYPVFETKAGRVGFQICYDIVFPEPSRILALQGAQVILHPSAGYNFPDEEEVVGEARLRVRAAENSVALVYANYAVPQHSYQCGGRSCVIDPRGAVVACAGRGEGLAVADVDLDSPRLLGWVREGYEHREHIWRKRRPDTYGLLTDLRPPVLRELKKPKASPLYHYREDVGLP